MKFEVGKGITVEPYQAGTPGYLCMPLVSSTPVGREGWREVSCPVCGRYCWERPEQQDLLRENPYLKLCCTQCALTSVLKPKPEKFARLVEDGLGRPAGTICKIVDEWQDMYLVALPDGRSVLLAQAKVKVLQDDDRMVMMQLGDHCDEEQYFVNEFELQKYTGRQLLADIFGTATDAEAGTREHPRVIWIENWSVKEVRECALNNREN